jgi:hypothetical protein
MRRISSPIGQAADEAAFLQRADQAVDAGLGFQIQRLLHLLERWGDAARLQPVMDEAEQLMLLARQHRRFPGPERTGNV